VLKGFARLGKQQPKHDGKGGNAKHKKGWPTQIFEKAVKLLCGSHGFECVSGGS
jgi:hypothetical protein